MVDLMKDLSNIYENPSTSNKIFLICHLFNFKMRGGAFVIEHINEFNVNTTQLISVDVKLDDDAKTLIFLSSLRENWYSTVMSEI